MQRKAYVPGVVALLAALLAGCTGGSDDTGSDDKSNPGEANTSAPAAQPGRYATLPEACGVVSRATLDSLLPGIQQLTDPARRETAYAGEATLTYDTDRKVGCRWKVESADATDHLLVDFERVVSYDNAVSDDSQAETLFAAQVTAADLPAPAASATAGVSPSTSATGSPGAAASSSSPAAASGSPSASSPPASASASAAASSTVAPADLQPRLLDDLGDEAFVDDALGSSGSTVKQRTVTVAFRTSNVIVTIQYEEQPATLGVTPDSEDMQDKARKLAARLVDALAG
ncbi:DUF3558 domain-containing protein [Streptomyces sp. ID05-04B]|uniref:hypothetical protein n=1 Tax=unclassified Streptomyces TaxID=2593676 RepID=UPI000D1BEB71|nr:MULTISPECIES: hypothetical protein [unclassified Streptomyces]AVV41162.1 hypothetical protein C6376_06600 [Streptomyces sp. P3]MDX5566691.1 DUF3558 domain-containing protein [Streptomyces sp. ID05-04B]